ncbi:MAG: hypothetical protein ACRCWI_03460 [Brevinema sp.]
MSLKVSPGPLVRFCLSPLIFIIDSAYQGVVAGIGVLILYPFISITIEGLKKRIPITDAFYIASFVGVLSGTLYILSVGLIDWGLYQALAFTFPASMASTSMIIGWLDDHQQDKEPTPFIEALISAILIILFACFRDFMLHGTLDFRFGEVGIVYNFGGFTPFKEFEQTVSSTKYIWLSSIKLRGIIFFIIGLLITCMGIDYKKGEKQ